MPGLSAAVSFTVDRITASWASLVGCGWVAGMPRIISALASHAHRRRSPIDCVSSDETRAAATARQSGPSVRLQLLDEAAALTLGVAVIAKAGASRGDRFAQH